jgi:hypothetical protein
VCVCVCVCDNQQLCSAFDFMKKIKTSKSHPLGLA